MHVKRSSLKYYFLFPYKQTAKYFFPDFSRLENDQTSFHNFQDSLCTLRM